MRAFIISIATILLLSGCTSSRSIQRLDSAQEQMMSHPELSLQILDSLKCKSLYGESRARYALLYTQAGRRNNIKPTDSSLIDYAVDYYSQHENFRDYALALYYKGDYLFNSSTKHVERLSAHPYIAMAEQLITKFDDPYIAGLIYSLSGQLHSICCDQERAGYSFERAYYYYNLAGLDTHKFWNLNMAAYCYNSLLMFEKSESLLKLALEWATASRNSEYYTMTVNGLCNAYINTSRASLAQRLISSELYDPQYHPFHTYSIHVGIERERGNYSSAQKYLEMVKSSASNDSEQLNYLKLAKETEAHFGNFAKAYKIHESSIEHNNKIITTLISQPYLSTQLEFHKKISHERQNAISKQRLAIYLMVALIFIIILYIVVRIKNSRLKYEVALSNYELVLMELRELQGRVDIGQNIDILNFLLDKYYQSKSNTPKDIEELNIIKREIDRRINLQNNSTIKRMQEQIEDLTESDVKILNYMMLGLSYRAISIISEIKVESLYTKTRRIKLKIKNSNATDRDEFLVFIETKR